MNVREIASRILSMKGVYGDHGRHFCEYLARHIQKPDPFSVIQMHKYYAKESDTTKLNELLYHTVHEMKKCADRVYQIEAHLTDVVTRTPESIRIRGYSQKLSGGEILFGKKK